MTIKRKGGGRLEKWLHKEEDGGVEDDGENGIVGARVARMKRLGMNLWYEDQIRNREENEEGS